MDCEMVYTTWGPALARVSVVDLNDDLVLDLLVCLFIYYTFYGIIMVKYL